MGAATIAVPDRWHEATFQIKQFIEEYAQRSAAPFDVILTGQLDPEQIYIVEHSLTPFESQVCQNAISEMSEYLNHRLSQDPWQARTEITRQLQADLEEIGEIVEQRQRERER